ncbi:hypothetical protein HPP92_008048 [Vanilla planifolia]|uniref:F-box domain-containing protein n=1 Tax=Vanilla planifolia TaxID=51239 RepID=A0A835RNK0_VANPL|nr:hypothetical protein HPP92_008048 [Vanilla planifolia]
METQDGDEESPLHGNVLEAVLDYLPTIDLFESLPVSRSWRRYTSAALHRRSNPVLLTHLLCRRRGLPFATVAYDRYLRTWHPIRHVTNLPHVTCTLLPLALPLHPLATRWHLIPLNLLDRCDAIVALVGLHLVVAGGVGDLGYRTSTVEVFSIGSTASSWKECQAIPVSLRDSAAATWLAVAASDRRMYVLERGAAATSRLCWFDPALDRWGPVRVLQLGGGAVSVLALVVGPIGCDGKDRLFVVGSMDSGGLGMWEVEPESMEVRQIGAMPVEAASRIAGEGVEEPPTVGLSSVGGSGFLYDLMGRGEVFFCEFGHGRWSWEGIGRPPVVEENPMARIAFGCVLPKLPMV